MVIAGAAGLMGAAISAPVIYRILVHANSRQTVSEHLPDHAKKQGTPTMGGIIVLIGMLAGIVSVWRPEMLTPLIVVLGFSAIGFVDDFVVPRMMAGKRGLGWRQKLILQIVIVGLAFLSSGMGDWWKIALGIFIILFFSNAYNFADGLDTLSAGIALYWLFGFIAFVGSAWPLAGMEAGLLMSIALALAFLPFLFLNAHPAKIFMGDVGALPIGAFLGWLFVEFLFQAQAAFMPMPIFVVAVVAFSFLMIVELVPVPLQIGWVKLRGKRMFPFKTPVHHSLQDAGWSEGRITWTFHMLQIALGLMAYAAPQIWRQAP